MIFVIRHGERIDHVDPFWEDRAEKPWDPPLTITGRQQGSKTGQRLKSEGHEINFIFTSPFLRCLQTSAQIAKEVGNPPIMVEYGLAEYLTNEWFPQKPTFSDVDEMGKILPSLERNYRSLHDLDTLYPETWEAMEQRFMRVAKLLAAYEKPGNIVMVSHAYTLDYVAMAFNPIESNSTTTQLTSNNASTKQSFWSSVFRKKDKGESKIKRIADVSQVGSAGYCAISKFVMKSESNLVTFTPIYLMSAKHCDLL